MNDNLPPLPQTEWQLYMPDRPYDPGWVSSQDGFDDDQMREYGKLCRQQALEEAAKAIEDGEPQINRVGYAAFIRNMK